MRTPTPEEWQRTFEDWRVGLASKSDEDLLIALNREVGNPGWVSVRGHYLRYLRDEIDRRGFNCSAVDGLRSYPGKRPFKLVGRRLLFADGQSE